MAMRTDALIKNLLADTNVVWASFSNTSRAADVLRKAAHNINDSVRSGRPGNEVRADYIAEEDIARIFEGISTGFLALARVIRVIEELEAAEGPIEKGTHRRFMGKIEGDLNRLQSEINLLKGLEARK